MATAAGAARARARRGRPRHLRATELAPDRPELRHAARRGDGRRAQVRVAVSHALLMLHAERLLEGPGPVLLRLLLHRLRPRGDRRDERHRGPL